jgi:transketolase
VTLLATGSEVALALEARTLLAARGIEAAVVSMPCWALFDAADEQYRRAVLGTAPRLAVEAASPFGWERYVGDGGRIIAMPGFGASAPAEALYRHFGFTPGAVAEAAADLLESGRG